MMRDYKISKATAYREYNWAMQIFGDLDAVSVKADRLILQELGEIEENERGKFYFKIPLWFWEKNLEKIISDTLEFFNKDKEEEKKFKKNDFKLWSLE